jgi:myosin V
MSSLIHNIYATSNRCLKPNSSNVGDEFDDALIVGQLRCGGVLEAVRVSRAGYPKRLTHDEFIKGYEFYVFKDGDRPSVLPRGPREFAKLLCDQLAQKALAHPQFVPSEDALGQSDKMMLAGIQCGKTLVFMRSRTFDFLEREKLIYHRSQAVKIQANFRKYSAMNAYRHTKHCILVVQCCIRKFLAVRKVQNLKFFTASRMVQKCYRGCRVRRVVNIMMRGFKRLQGVYRSIKSRAATAEYRKNYRAAVLVQCMVRRKLARKRLRENRIEAKSVAKIMQDKEELSKKLLESKEELNKKLKKTEEEHSRKLLETASKFEAERASLLVNKQTEVDTLKTEMESAKKALQHKSVTLASLQQTIDALDAEKSYLSRELDEVKNNSVEKEYVNAMEIELDTVRSDVVLFQNRSSLLEVQVDQLKKDLEGTLSFEVRYELLSEVRHELLSEVK